MGVGVRTGSRSLKQWEDLTAQVGSTRPETGRVRTRRPVDRRDGSPTHERVVESLGFSPPSPPTTPTGGRAKDTTRTVGGMGPQVKGEAFRP